MHHYAFLTPFFILRYVILFNNSSVNALIIVLTSLYSVIRFPREMRPNTVKDGVIVLMKKIIWGWEGSFLM